jgi:acyl-CoA synthetase (AMP-forming)/AMP-acid ligase II
VGLVSSTLVGLLHARPKDRASKVAYIFLDATGAEATRFTFGQLLVRANAIAALLRRNLEPGERVILLCPEGPEFVGAFFGCLCAGLIAVPVQPIQTPRDVLKLEAIATDAGSHTILSTKAMISAIRRSPGALASFSFIPLEDAVDDDTDDPDPDPSVNSDSIAFLQYTSGSTGQPKGVMVSHGNLLHNLAMMADAFEHDAETVIVGWLPLFHDMGLIGNLLQALFMGVTGVLISPLDFLKRPAIWLEAITRYRGTFAGAPNFAYDLCVRRISKDVRSQLDLSSWKVAFNGAEPIRASVLESFASVFTPCGFRREAFYPCYGLAEATLFVSGGNCAAAPVVLDVDREALEGRIVVDAHGAGARTLVGCGHSWSGQIIAIAAPDEATICPPNCIGEIWVAGPSVAKGYWGQPDACRRTFDAHVVGIDEPFLRTGDLGFLRNGELFVTGRLKDLIIIRGRNHSAEDIEHTAEASHEALRPGCGAAFSVEKGSAEALVLVHEVKREYEDGGATAEVIGNIREAVAAAHGLNAQVIRLVPSGTLPKTSSGKLQRHACREMFLAGSFSVVKASSADGEAVSGE